jgi:predicted kinase
MGTPELTGEKAKTMSSSTLFLICGKIAAGKSTLAAKLASDHAALLMAEDDWLSALYPGQITTAADYVQHAARLRSVIGPHVSALLNAGLSVVLDFPANTPTQRLWMRGILDATAADHELHVLNPPDHVCIERLRRRNAGGDHPFAATEEQFSQFSKHFAMPTPDEGFAIVMHETAL